MSTQSHKDTQELEDHVEDLISETQDQNPTENTEEMQNDQVSAVQEQTHESQPENLPAHEPKPSNFLSSNCSKHPEEELQFYCYTKNRALCAECLVTGKYAGMEISNLKKAADKLKDKLNTLLVGTKAKLESCVAAEKELQVYEDEIENTFSNHEDEIVSQINQLRQRINLKEQELLDNLANVRQQRLKSLKGVASLLQNYHEEINAVRNVNEENLKNLNDLNLCNHYVQRSNAIKGLIADEIPAKVHQVKEEVDHFHLQDQMAINRLQEHCHKVITQVESIFGFELSAQAQDFIPNASTNINHKEDLKTAPTSSFLGISGTEQPREAGIYQNLSPMSGAQRKSTYLKNNVNITNSTLSVESTADIFEKHQNKVHRIRRASPNRDAPTHMRNSPRDNNKELDNRTNLIIEMKRASLEKNERARSPNVDMSNFVLDGYKKRQNNYETTPSNKSYINNGGKTYSFKNLTTDLSTSSSSLINHTKSPRNALNSSLEQIQSIKAAWNIPKRDSECLSKKSVTRTDDILATLGSSKISLQKKTQERPEVNSLQGMDFKKKLGRLSSALFN